jgi:hypothetical protein
MPHYRSTGSILITSATKRPAAAGVSLKEAERFSRATGIEIPVLIDPLESGKTLRGGSNLLRNIRDFFSSARVIDAFDSIIEIPAAELHCPKLESAEASVTMGTVATHSKSAIILFGIGGGAEHEIQVEEAWTVSTSNGECIRIHYQVPAAWERCEIADADGQWRQFVRLKSVSAEDPGIRTSVIAHDDDQCLTTDVMTPQRQPIDLTTLQSGKVTKVLKIAANEKWSGKAKLAAPGIEASSEFSAKRSEATSWQYTLPGGHSYVALRATAVPGFAWNLIR